MIREDPYIVLARYQCISYFDNHGLPHDPGLSMSSEGPTFLKHLGLNHYMYFATEKVKKPSSLKSSVLRLHERIKYANDSVIVRNPCWGFLISPDPRGYAVLCEREFIDQLEFKDTKYSFPPMPISHYSKAALNDHYIPKERMDFLAAAESAPLGLGRTIEYIRTLEAAFNSDGRRLFQLLKTFLSSSPSFKGDDEYTDTELLKWKKLRDNLAHAGYKKNWVSENASWKILPRLRQATFDVVISKKNWNRKDTERNSGILMNCVVSQSPINNLSIVKDSDSIIVETFKYDMFGVSYLDQFWIGKVAKDIGKDGVDYLEPVFERFPDLVLSPS